MRLRVEKLSDRYPAGKLPVFVFYAFFLAYLGIHFGLEAWLRLCWFRALTGINCPTCGLFRGFISLLGGHPLRALLSNPLMLIFTLFVFFQQSATLAFKRRLALDATPRQRRLLLILFLALFLLNWLYLILFLP
ncbi:MAG: DUF2752 domain-containing protein [Candidatus Syntrophosphaera sp.]|nr:DUF2752 domain-containing protein [Candidatus Syntrophosphaera sp.]